MALSAMGLLYLHENPARQPAVSPARRRAGLSDAAGARDRRLPAGRHHRRHRPHGGERARASRPASRSWSRTVRGASGTIGTAAVAKAAPDGHTPDRGAEHARHRARAVRLAALRGRGARAGGPGRQHALRLRGPSEHAGEDLRRPDRAAEGKSRQVRLRLHQPRHRAAPRRRAGEAHGGRRHGARALQGNRRRDARPAFRPRADDVREPGGDDAAHPQGLAAPARGFIAEAHPPDARSADGRRDRRRPRGLRGAGLVRAARAGAHAAGGGAHAQRGAGPHDRQAGGRGALRRSRRRAARRHAGATRPTYIRIEQDKWGRIIREAGIKLL